MFSPDQSDLVRVPSDETPLLIVIADVEAEFDWSKPITGSETSVKSVKFLECTDDIFDRYRITPTFVIDYPVAAQAEGRKPIIERLSDDRCVIGAHLQPWYNPPQREDVSDIQNTFPGNLSADLEYEKLAYLTDTIEANLGRRPKIYRAGRFGIGPNTASTLCRLGYEIDSSVIPKTDFRPYGGPNFLECNISPYWFGQDHRLLEIPLTVGFTGLLGDINVEFYSHLEKNLGAKLHLPGVFARTHLIDRIRLSPEGVTFKEMRRLTRVLLGQGCRVFNFTFHSPSLQPGNTPYVRTERDREIFLDRFERFFDFFFGEVGGRAVTPLEFRDMAERLRSNSVAAAQ